MVETSTTVLECRGGESQVSQGPAWGRGQISTARLTPPIERSHEKHGLSAEVGGPRRSVYVLLSLATESLVVNASQMMCGGAASAPEGSPVTCPLHRGVEPAGGSRGAGGWVMLALASDEASGTAPVLEQPAKTNTRNTSALFMAGTTTIGRAPYCNRPSGRCPTVIRRVR